MIAPPAAAVPTEGRVTPFVTVDGDGDINIDFVHSSLRFGVILYPGKNKVSWYCVSKDFEILSNGDVELPEIV